MRPIATGGWSNRSFLTCLAAGKRGAPCARENSVPKSRYKQEKIPSLCECERVSADTHHFAPQLTDSAPGSRNGICEDMCATVLRNTYLFPSQHQAERVEACWESTEVSTCGPHSNTRSHLVVLLIPQRGIRYSLPHLSKPPNGRAW